MKRQRPPLVVLDFHNGVAIRYARKPTGGFLTQTGNLQKPPGDPWMLGSPEGLALLESFRRGELAVEPETEKEYA